MSTELSVNYTLPSLTPEQDDLMLELKERALALPQVAFKTHHVLHAGMYCRTILITAGTFIVGAKIKKPTLVTICGSARLFIPTGPVDLSGYAVLPGMPDRRMALLALEDTHISMTFVTQAKTVQEAEAEFTDETEDLLSRVNENEITITGV